MDDLEQVKSIIRESSNIVAFTGAGVSTESNIPDFRSSKGLYRELEDKYKYPPEYMLSHTFFVNHTDLFFDYYRNKMIYPDAKPNDCHLALAKLEEMGKLKAVITQNIDGLHQAAGSRNVLELHGTVLKNYCVRCRKPFSLDYIMDMSVKVPVCDECGGVVRPDVVLYEETLDSRVLEAPVSYIRKADVLLIIGTSLVVYPAAGLIEYYRGDKLVLINRSSTPYDSRARFVIRDSAGKTMREIMAALGQ